MTGPERRPVREDFLVFGAPAIGDDEIAEVVASLRSGWLGTGPKVARFESDFAAYVRAPHAVAVSSCTAALHLSMLALGVGPGDEVITTALTFAATVNAIIHAGATPVLADVDPRDHEHRSGRRPRRRSRRARAPSSPSTSPAGRATWTRFWRCAASTACGLIEDCAHAIETEYHGRHAGTFGDFGCFSFYVTKNVVTGEGGMVLASREEDAARIKTLALHGMSKDAWKRFSRRGLQALLRDRVRLQVQHDRPAGGARHPPARARRAQPAAPRGRLAALPARRSPTCRSGSPRRPSRTPGTPTTSTRSWSTRSAAAWRATTCSSALTERNIGAGVHYLSIPEHPYYRERFGWRPEDYPAAQRIGRQTVSLPLSPALEDGDVDDVIAAVREVLGR